MKIASGHISQCSDGSCLFFKEKCMKTCCLSSIPTMDCGVKCVYVRYVEKSDVGIRDVLTGKPNIRE